MSKSLQTLRSHVRTYLDEVSEADWTDTQVDREINYAYMTVVSGVMDVYEEFYVKRSKRLLESGVAEYSLPDDFIKLNRFEIAYQSDEDRVKATRYKYDQLTRPWNSSDIGSASKPVYGLRGNYIRILPVPSETVTDGMFMEYVPTISELSANSDTINIPNPDRYGSLIVLGASAQLLRKGQQEESVASKYIAEFEMGIEKMKQELKDRISDGPNMIVDTLGDWNDFSATPGFTAIYT